MGKKAPINEMSYAQLLGDARTNATKNDAAITELLFRLTNKKKWTHRQCLDVYESILRQYLDDEDNLQLLLALSGLMDGYKSIKTAVERRGKYLNYLDEIDSASKHRGKEPETLRKDEDDLLEYVAKRLEDDLESGTLSQLIEKWTSPQSIGPININWKNIKKTSLTAVAVAIVVVLLLRCFPSSTPSTGDTFFVESITVVKGDIIMSPNTYYSLVVADSLDKPSGSVFSYVSSDPSVVAVGEHSGMLHTAVSHPAGGVQTADITIKGENGATVAKTVSVDFDLPNNNSTYDAPDNSGPGHNVFPDSNSGPGHSVQLDDFVPEFTVSQKIRIAGDTEWHNYVDAEVGDELEIQFEYRNTSANEHVNVAVRDILPTNLEYIPGSTTIYTTQTPTGLKKEDGIVGNGIYIGTYGSNSNAYVRFRVRVVDINLADGVTGLVNWSQACVNDVTLQDFATVRVSQ